MTNKLEFTVESELWRRIRRYEMFRKKFSKTKSQPQEIILQEIEETIREKIIALDNKKCLTDKLNALLKFIQHPDIKTSPGVEWGQRSLIIRKLTEIEAKKSKLPGQHTHWSTGVVVALVAAENISDGKISWENVLKHFALNYDFLDLRNYLPDHLLVPVGRPFKQAFKLNVKYLKDSPDFEIKPQDIDNFKDGGKRLKEICDRFFTHYFAEIYPERSDLKAAQKVIFIKENFPFYSNESVQS